jgi:pyruvate kinase
VSRAQDVEQVRKLLQQRGADLPIAKIERGQAISHIEEILLASDAIMVAGVIWALIFPLSSSRCRHHPPL